MIMKYTSIDFFKNKASPEPPPTFFSPTNKPYHLPQLESPKKDYNVELKDNVLSIKRKKVLNIKSKEELLKFKKLSPRHEHQFIPFTPFQEPLPVKPKTGSMGKIDSPYFPTSERIHYWRGKEKKDQHSVSHANINPNKPEGVKELDEKVRKLTETNQEKEAMIEGLRRALVVVFSFITFSEIRIISFKKPQKTMKT